MRGYDLNTAGTQFCCVVRQYRITPEGKKLLKWYEQRKDADLTDIAARVLRCARETETFAGFAIENDILVLFFDGHPPEVVPLSYFAKTSYRSQKLQQLKRFLEWKKREEPTSSKWAAARAYVEKYLKDHPDWVTEKQTVIGTIKLVGDVEHSSFELNRRIICIQPEQSIASVDMYLWRLIWLNAHTDELVREIVRYHLLKECSECHTILSSIPKHWKMCPACGAPIDAMVQEFLERASARVK